MHLMPSEGFPIVIPLLNLLKDQLKDCKKEKERQKMLEYLTLNIRLIEQEVMKIDGMVAKNGAEYIHDHCTELRRLVQLSTEEKILRLNDLNEKTISKIDAYEKLSVLNFNEKKMNYANLETIRLNSEKILNEAKAYLAGFRIHDEQVITSAIVTDHLKEQLEYEFEKFDRSLFNSNKINFKVIVFGYIFLILLFLIKFNYKVNEISFDENILGEIEYKDCKEHNYYDTETEEFLSEIGSQTDTEDESDTEWESGTESEREREHESDEEEINRLKHEIIHGDFSYFENQEPIQADNSLYFADDSESDDFVMTEPE